MKYDLLSKLEKLNTIVPDQLKAFLLARNFKFRITNNKIQKLILDFMLFLL